MGDTTQGESHAAEEETGDAALADDWIWGADGRNPVLAAQYQGTVQTFKQEGHESERTEGVFECRG